MKNAYQVGYLCGYLQKQAQEVAPEDFDPSFLDKIKDLPAEAKAKALTAYEQMKALGIQGYEAAKPYAASPHVQAGALGLTAAGTAAAVSPKGKKLRNAGIAGAAGAAAPYGIKYGREYGPQLAALVAEKYKTMFPGKGPEAAPTA